jgi:protein-S-isoprenylcysteine O-methyltransferase Ste14
MRLMTTSGISDQSSPDSTKLGGWLFRHRTALPIPIALALLLLRIGMAPFSWTLVGAGVILTAGGESLRLWSVHHIGVISRTRSGRLGPLVTTGPFALVRNPLYIGNMLLWVGLALTAHLVWAAPIVAILLLAEYHLIVRWEEQLLQSRYGDVYVEYSGRVPRWWPAPARTERPERGYRAAAETTTYSWRETLFSERGTLIAIAAGYVLLGLKARF